MLALTGPQYAALTVNPPDEDGWPISLCRELEGFGLVVELPCGDFSATPRAYVARRAHVAFLASSPEQYQ